GAEDFVMQAVGEEGVCGVGAQVLQWQNGESQDTCFRWGGRLLRAFSNRCCLCVTGPLVVPERPAPEQQQQREDRELGGADALLATVTVVVGDDKDDGQADQEYEGGVLLNLTRPGVGAAEVFESLQ